MIETNIEIEERKLPFDKDYNFTKTVLFYIMNENYNSAAKFVLVDFLKGKLTYINTLTNDYINKLYEFPYENSKICSILKNTSWHKCPKNTPFKISQPHFPHSSLCFDINEGFYSFLTAKPTIPLTSFRYVNLKENKMIHYFGEDIGFLNTRFNETSSTSDSNYFVISLDGQENDVTYHIKCSKDMKEIELIGKTEDTSVAPHETYWYDNKIFSTEFFVKRYNINGKIFRDDESLEKYFGNLPSYDTIMELYKQGCFGYGELKQIDDKGLITYKTGIVPSHIEHDIINNVFYISSHNMLIIFNKIFFLDQASIMKYIYDGDVLKKDSEFKHSTGYRFTSHKFFRRNGKSYFATIGHPNRIFIVNGETMKLDHFIDIGNPILNNKKDIGRFLSTEHTQSIHDPLRISTMEISSDGKYAVFLMHDKINVVDLWTGECVSHLFYIGDDGFFQRTYHSETLPNIVE